MVEYITDLDKFNELIASENLVVIDFTATWCGPCKMISPEFEKMSLEYPDCIFKKVDVDNGCDISEQCGISCMPTFQLYKNGANVEVFSGADVVKLRELIEKNK